MVSENLLLICNWPKNCICDTLGQRPYCMLRHHLTDLQKEQICLGTEFPGSGGINTGCVGAQHSAILAVPGTSVLATWSSFLAAGTFFFCKRDFSSASRDLFSGWRYWKGLFEITGILSTKKRIRGGPKKWISERWGGGPPRWIKKRLIILVIFFCNIKVFFKACLAFLDTY